MTKLKDIFKDKNLLKSSIDSLRDRIERGDLKLAMELLDMIIHAPKSIYPFDSVEFENIALKLYLQSLVKEIDKLGKVELQLSELDLSTFTDIQKSLIYEKRISMTR